MSLSCHSFQDALFGNSKNPSTKPISSAGIVGGRSEVLKEDIKPDNLHGAEGAGLE